MSEWRAANGEIIAKANGFGLLGVLNLTPDSFYDGASYQDAGAALAKAGSLIASGADIIDIGAESTRPGAMPVDPAEEWRRLDAPLSLIRQKRPDAVISVDTRNASTARRALELGCAIINDVSACRHDPALVEILGQFKPGYVLMHCQNEPRTMQANPVYGDVVSEVAAFFDFHLNRLVRAGLPEDRIALDPGFGFGKNLDHNLALLKNVGIFLRFGRPLLAGISMKGMFGKLLGLLKEERGCATAVLSALLYEKGVIWHRVHEPDKVGQALKLAQAVN